MTEVEDYMIVDGDSETQLVQRVHTFLKLGYRPLGGPQIAVDDNQARFWYQAMILESEQRPPRA